MKKIVFAIALSMAFISCKNAEEKMPEESNETSEITTNSETANRYNIHYKGEFIYLADGAVLKGNNFIFGVTQNEKALELSKRVAPVKKDEFDMVPVVVKGTVERKKANEEGWEQVLTITEIISVSDTPATPDVKIEAKKN
ncbi:hypothetical protein [Altibacter sp.]|uniref:hypothetical protein n=1 Tax=Altibacter sp. TaxID=2024823 RepID=UPI000C8AA055|nr:hypothetical protein [Altibacter sp.]MAP54002.1 hypothetical protein [Altibacter sp.]